MPSPAIYRAIKTTSAQQVFPRRPVAKILHFGLIETRPDADLEYKREFNFAEVLLLRHNQCLGRIDHLIYKNVCLIKERNKASNSYQNQWAN